MLFRTEQRFHLCQPTWAWNDCAAGIDLRMLANGVSAGTVKLARHRNPASQASPRPARVLPGVSRASRKDDRRRVESVRESSSAAQVAPKGQRGLRAGRDGVGARVLAGEARLGRVDVASRLVEGAASARFAGTLAECRARVCGCEGGSVVLDAHGGAVPEAASAWCRGPVA